MSDSFILKLNKATQEVTEIILNSKLNIEDYRYYTGYLKALNDIKNILKELRQNEC